MEKGNKRPKVHCDQNSRWPGQARNVSKEEISRRWASAEIVQKEKQASRVKHPERQQSTINKKRLRLTADLFIPAASIDRFSRSLSIKVLDDHTKGEKKGEAQTNKTDPKGFSFPIVFRFFFGRPTPPRLYLYRAALLL